jgi:hypothetical protein
MDCLSLFVWPIHTFPYELLWCFARKVPHRLPLSPTCLARWVSEELSSKAWATEIK